MNVKMAVTILLLGVLAVVCNSCNGQQSTNDRASIADARNGVPDTVQELGERLWYVYEDKKGNYWYGSNGEGVYKYDGKTILNYTTKSGLTNDSIRQIQEDEKGNMFFSTLGGICKYDGKKMTPLKPIRTKEWKLEQHDMWFCILGRRNEHGPYRYDGKNLYSLEFPKHYLHDEFYAGGINPFFSPYEVYTIYKDRKGAMWFGTSVFGACRYDGVSVKWMYEKDLTIVPAGGSFGIRSVYEDREGRFWICNTRHRYVFDNVATAKSDRLKYNKVEGVGDSIIFGGDDYVYYSYVVEDNDDNIWLTTWDKGVYKYDGKYFTNYTVREGVKDVNLVSMYKDRMGGLWLGTNENGVYKYNGKDFERFVR